MGDVDNNGDDHVLTLRFVPRTIIYWKLRRAFPLFFLVSLVNSSVKTAIFFQFLQWSAWRIAPRTPNVLMEVVFVCPGTPLDLTGNVTKVS